MLRMSNEWLTPATAVDHLRSVTCPQCGIAVALPTTEPWLIAGADTIPPTLESLRCPHCRARIYVSPVTDAQQAEDAALDARDDEGA